MNYLKIKIIIFNIIFGKNLKIIIILLQNDDDDDISKIITEIKTIMPTEIIIIIIRY